MKITRKQLEEAIESVPATTANDIVEEKGILFRLRRKWLSQVLDNLEVLIKGKEKNEF